MAFVWYGGRRVPGNISGITKNDESVLGVGSGCVFVAKPLPSSYALVQGLPQADESRIGQVSLFLMCFP